MKASSRFLFNIKSSITKSSRTLPPIVPRRSIFNQRAKIMTSSLPKTQRALLQPDPKSTSIIITTLPVPTPDFSKDEHLIKVHTVSPCNGELLWTANFPPPAEFAAAKSLVPCDDVAGVVISAPPNSPFQPGSKVYGRTNYYRTGNAREYTIGTTEELALIPEGLSWANAATVGLSALTAWQALFVQAGIEDGGYRGKRVLVTAASGSVGSWVVQLAKVAGAEVIGTCGPDNIDFVRSLGASEVLNYRSEDLKAWAEGEGKKVDIVIDTIGRKSLEDAWWTVKDGGLLMSIFQPPESARPQGYKGKDVKNFFFIMVPDGKNLAKVSKLLEEGKVKPNLDSVFPFEKFEDAFKRVEGGHAKGKVVIEISN
ncbi:hypothetical protein B0O99DRAFT_634350 [Bisporella sp. PMI_857]|nr:hypothetical protein B0O99DRAFT_634350 [Bisporella sp. PMI_857]